MQINKADKQIIDYWHPTKNVNKSPYDFTPGSTYPAWWLCPVCGNEWQTSISHKYRGDKCPVCSGRKVVPGINDLQSQLPGLAAEWDFSKNELTPSEVYYRFSNKKFWWVCDKCHSYEAKITNRIAGTGCPYCANKKVLKGFNDLATVFPDIAAEWDYDKNEELTPDSIVYGSNNVVFWKCSKCGYSWKTSVINRTLSGTGCNRCKSSEVGNKRMLSAAKENSLADSYPELAEEWLYEKNNGLTPHDVSPGSTKSFWWKCSFCENIWKATVNHRTNGQGCPSCYLGNSSIPEQAVYYYVSQVYPDAVNRFRDYGFELDIYIPSIKTAIEYDGAYYHKSKDSFKKDNEKGVLCRENGIKLIRVRDKSLPYAECYARIDCDDKKRKNIDKTVKNTMIALGVNQLPSIDFKKDYSKILGQFRLQKQEASIAARHPELMAEWDNEKNIGIDPKNISANSELVVSWICSKCHNHFEQAISNRNAGRGCSICARKTVVPGYNDLATLYPNIADEWDYDRNAGVIPSEVFPKSNNEYFWKCKLGHSWEARSAERVRGRGCPICSNHKVLVGFNDLKTTRPDLAAEWDYERNLLDIETIVAGSNKKAFWICSECGNKWEAVISSRSAGRGCPECGKKKSAETTFQKGHKKNSHK